jgi:hypothetical protein
VKASYKIKQVSSVMSIFGLVLLLLLSPCKVRSFIQAELGIPKTNVLSKSQSTAFQTHCQNFEVSETVNTTSKPVIQQPNFLISEAYHFEFTVNLIKHSFNLNTSRNQLVSDVPLYILHQNLLVYS